MNNGGDVLARGGRSATFPPAKVSQEKWNAIWADDKPAEVETKTPAINVEPLLDEAARASRRKRKKE